MTSCFISTRSPAVLETRYELQEHNLNSTAGSCSARTVASPRFQKHANTRHIPSDARKLVFLSNPCVRKGSDDTVLPVVTWCPHTWVTALRSAAPASGFFLGTTAHLLSSVRASRFASTPACFHRHSDIFSLTSETQNKSVENRVRLLDCFRRTARASAYHIHVYISRPREPSFLNYYF